MPSDAVRFLADSPDRMGLLKRVRDDPGTPRDFAAELDQSRRSVQRHLAAFEERGWVTKRNGDYHLTTKGDLTATEHRTYVTAMETIDDHHLLYRHLPREVVPEPRLLDGSTVVEAESDHPQAPVSHYVSVVESVETDHIRMIAPVLSRLFHEAHAKRVLEGVETELILDGESVTAARNKNPAEFATVVAVPNFSLFRHANTLSFGLTVADKRALLLAYDGDGQLRACVDSGESAFLAWASEVYERFLDQSERVTGRDLLRS